MDFTEVREVAPPPGPRHQLDGDWLVTQHNWAKIRQKQLWEINVEKQTFKWVKYVNGKPDTVLVGKLTVNEQGRTFEIDGRLGKHRETVKGTYAVSFGTNLQVHIQRTASSEEKYVLLRESY